MREIPWGLAMVWLPGEGAVGLGKGVLRPCVTEAVCGRGCGWVGRGARGW